MCAATGDSGTCRTLPFFARGTVSRNRSRSTFSHVALSTSCLRAPVTTSSASAAPARRRGSASSACISACVCSEAGRDRYLTAEHPLGQCGRSDLPLTY